MTHTQIDVIIGTIQTSEQQVITERELARVVGCERTALANVRERHSDRFTVLDAEKSAKNQLVKKCDRFILTLKIQAEDGKMREQICYSPKAALEVCRHLRFPIADEVMDKLYELAEGKPAESPKTPLEITVAALAVGVEEIKRLTAENTKLTAELKQAEMRDYQNCETIINQAREIETNKPKVLFADAVSCSDTHLLIGEFAKILRQNGVNVGQNRFFEWLRRDGYLCKKQGQMWNSPTQRSKELGLFHTKETVLTHSDGHTTISLTHKITGKGQQHLLIKYLPQ